MRDGAVPVQGWRSGPDPHPSATAMIPHAGNMKDDAAPRTPVPKTGITPKAGTARC